MCELGSQGGMDGRWHCSAAQVEILLFKHAGIVLFTSCLSHPVSISSLPNGVYFRPSLCQHVLLIDYEKTGTKREQRNGVRWRVFLMIALIWHIC